MKKTISTDAQAAFIAAIAQAHAALAIIRSALDDHMGVNPDNVTWAHVGDAQRINAALRQIATCIPHANCYECGAIALVNARGLCEACDTASA